MMKKIRDTLFTATLLLFTTLASALPGMNLPFGVTPISQQIYKLHMITLWVCVVIGVLVFGFLFYSLFKYRKSKGAVPATFHEHTGVEIAWTVIPFLILLALAFPATKLLARIDNTNNPALNIAVKGYQWKWHYKYLDQGIGFFSQLSTPQDQIDGKAKKDKYFLLEVDHPLVVPIHEKIRLLVTSNDVIHSWWVPDLGVKQDAIPGYVNENWMYIDKVGTYRGQCAELCGTLHAFMPIVVKAVTKLEFANWVKAHQAKAKATKARNAKAVRMTKSELMQMGHEAYRQHCAMCHQDKGQGLPPNFPSLHASKITVGPVADNIKTVMHGVKGTAMQAWDTQLDNNTLAAVITYVRNSWGNAAVNAKRKHETVVQPADIKKYRKD